MISIRSSVWAAALSLPLALAVGCGSTEEPAPAPAGGGSAPADWNKRAADNPPTGEAKPAEAPKTEAPKIEAPKAEPAKEAPKGAAAAVKLDDDELAEIKKLPAEDQKVALAQLVCPVSDEHLGAMGVPMKVSAEGKSFFICCKGCKEDVEKNGKAIVAKLAK